MSQFDYSSHVPLLAAAVARSSGPVLELGAGPGSTLLLHGLCGTLRRKLVTIENNAVWLDAFKAFARKWHTFRKVESFQRLDEYSEQWGLAFVDHGIAEQRLDSIQALTHVPLIVVHDTCYSDLYRYEPTLSEFRFRFDVKLEGPQTTVVSNSIDVRKMFEGTL